MAWIPLAAGLLSVSMRTLPLGVACTVWTAIGVAGAVPGESASSLRMFAAVRMAAGPVPTRLAPGE